MLQILPAEKRKLAVASQSPSIPAALHGTSVSKAAATLIITLRSSQAKKRKQLGMY